MDDYKSAIEFLYGRINYERVDAQAYSTSDFKLDRMRLLLSLLDNPQDRIPAVHVAGTKGKGSTCAMIAAALTAAGYRTGLYISPHITAFEERMTVDGVRPSPEKLVELVNRLIPVVGQMDNMPGQMQPTYFELATAIAWLHFIDRQVEIVVLETGLGGRLDSTNICRPHVCILTNVSRDHTHILGSTVRQIAWEKAGIVKPNVPVICGVSQPEALRLIEQICRERAAPLILFGRDLMVTARQTFNDFNPDLQDSDPVLETQQSGVLNRESDPAPCSRIDVMSGGILWKDVPVALRGAHQATNTALALAAIDQLRARGMQISDLAVRTGLARVQWPARVEVVARRPTVVIDAAHNWESARALVATLKEDFRPRRRFLIFAATRDKDVAGLLRLLLPAFDTVIFTRYLDNPRGVPVPELRAIVHAISDRPVHTVDNPIAAWRMARHWAEPEDLIAITGSFFLVAELRDIVIADGRVEHGPTLKND